MENPYCSCKGTHRRVAKGELVPPQLVTGLECLEEPAAEVGPRLGQHDLHACAAPRLNAQHDAISTPRPAHHEQTEAGAEWAGGHTLPAGYGHFQRHRANAHCLNPQLLCPAAVSIAGSERAGCGRFSARRVFTSIVTREPRSRWFESGMPPFCIRTLH